MPDPDTLQPGGKDPRDSDDAPEAGDHPEESHLGEAGDPAEG